MSIYLLSLIAAIVAQIMGTIWHMPLFGRIWGKSIGYEMPTDPEERKKGNKMMIVPLIINFAGNYATSFVLYLILAGFGAFAASPAIITALVIFSGFFLPMAAGAVMWRGYSVKNQWIQFGINAGFQLINLVVMALLFVWLV